MVLNAYCITTKNPHANFLLKRINDSVESQLVYDP